MTKGALRSAWVATTFALGSCAGQSGPASVSTPAATAPAPARDAGLPLKHAPAPTSAELSATDLMTRMYVFADDSMEGREFATRGNVKATDYLAAEVQRMGLEPAGENGTYFQTLPVQRRVLDLSSVPAVDGNPLAPWTDFTVLDQGPGTHSIAGATAVYGGAWGDTARMATPAAARGKVLVLAIPRNAAGVQPWTVSRQALAIRYPGAVGFALITLDVMPQEVRDYLRSPGLQVGTPDQTERPAFFWVSAAAAARILGGDPARLTAGATGRTFSGDFVFRTEPAEFPARNVIALLRGSDPAVRGQYVAIGAHNDHVGLGHEPVDHDSLRAWNTVMRPQGADDEPGTPSAEQWTRIRALLDSLRRLRPARPDSIANGADDDGSGSVAMLEIAQQLAAASQRPRRSILFVWHTGEEAGLFGSAYFTAHPTVPRDSIVAQLNIDMIGRGGADDVAAGGPGYLELIGSGASPASWATWWNRSTGTRATASASTTSSTPRDTPASTTAAVTITSTPDTASPSPSSAAVDTAITTW